MTVCRILESYPPLPENCKELPKAIESNAGADLVATLSNNISEIYYELYGDTSNEPAIINAIKRDFDASTRNSYVYYDRTLKCYQRMLKIKEVHPEVDFPSVEELRKLVEKYTPLAKDEAWERYIR